MDSKLTHSGVRRKYDTMQMDVINMECSTCILVGSINTAKHDVKVEDYVDVESHSGEKFFEVNFE